MINIVELYDIIAYRYLNCYRAYLDSLHNDNLELRLTLLHRTGMKRQIIRKGTSI